MATLDPGSASSQVKSATRTLDIIEYVVAHGRPLVAQEIAIALGIPVSSLSYLLATLLERGYLTRDGRRYSAGPGLERLQARSGGMALAERAAPLVRTLRTQLDETVSFWIRQGWEAEPIATESSAQALRYAVETGRRLPMHALAAGKAILAALPDDELESYFGDTRLERFTAKTITVEDKLREALGETRLSGFGYTDEEFTLGIESIGRAVIVAGQPVGAFSVAVPKARFNDTIAARARELLARAATLLGSV